jgi:DNA anti-recombination protein RmuC
MSDRPCRAADCRYRNVDAHDVEVSAISKRAEKEFSNAWRGTRLALSVHARTMYRRLAVAGEDMSEERFERIEGRLTELTHEMREMKADVGRQIAEVKSEVTQQIAEVREDVKQQIAEVKEDVRQQIGEVKRQIIEVKEDVGRQMRVMYEDLSGHMRVLHEDLVDRIKAIPGHTGPTRAEFDDYRETTDRRISPLELAVRQHSADIKMLKSPRG